MTKALGQTPRIRKTPERTCIACGRKTARRDLLRFVRTPEGRVVFDASMRANGRGAYVCSWDCARAAIEGKRLGRALRTGLADEDYERIADEVRAARLALHE